MTIVFHIHVVKPQHQNGENTWQWYQDICNHIRFFFCSKKISSGRQFFISWEFLSRQNCFMKIHWQGSFRFFQEACWLSLWMTSIWIDLRFYSDWFEHEFIPDRSHVVSQFVIAFKISHDVCFIIKKLFWNCLLFIDLDNSVMNMTHSKKTVNHIWRSWRLMLNFHDSMVSVPIFVFRKMFATCHVRREKTFQNFPYVSLRNVKASINFDDERRLEMWVFATLRESKSSAFRYLHCGIKFQSFIVVLTGFVWLITQFLSARFPVSWLFLFFWDCVRFRPPWFFHTFRCFLIIHKMIVSRSSRRDNDLQDICNMNSYVEICFFFKKNRDHGGEFFSVSVMLWIIHYSPFLVDMIFSSKSTTSQLKQHFYDKDSICKLIFVVSRRYFWRFSSQWCYLKFPLFDF